MSLQTRQKHLAEMGVSQWHSRFTLMGAAITPVILVEASSCIADSGKKRNSENVKLPEIEGTIPITPARALGGVGALIDEVSQENIAGASSALVLSPSTNVETEHSASPLDSFVNPKTNLSPLENISWCTYSAKDYLAISDMGVNVDHQETLALLQNIIRAIDSECGKFDFVGEFNWPVFNSAKVLVGQEKIHEKLIGRWLASYQLESNKVLLCFGQQSKEMIESFLGDALEPNKKVNIVSCAHSLAELYKLPSRKKDLWQVLIESSDKLKVGKLGG